MRKQNVSVLLSFRGLLATLLSGILMGLMFFMSQHLTAVYMPGHPIKTLAIQDLVFKVCVFFVVAIFVGSFGFHVANAIFF